MRALGRVNKLLEDRMGFMHAHRYQALWRVVCSLIRGKQLWLTALGRSLPSGARPKHSIKAVDRLLGNPHLHEERFQVAAALAALVIPRGCRPLILVDTMEIRERVVALSASVAFESRSVPIYSTVVSALNPTRKQRIDFLSDLARILPAGCNPVVVTDGGFRSEWFDTVASHGWDYVGRIRGQTRFLLDGKWVDRWHVHALATRTPKSLGIVPYPQSRPSPRRVVLSAKPRPRHRQVATRRGPARDNNHKHYRKNAYEPLVLATSLTTTARRVVDIYKTRMQCEEHFRDVKSHRWGWSMRHCGTRRTERVGALLLIASVAAIVQHLIGLVAKRCELQRGHQANTVSNRTVLSTFFLGGLVINSDDRHLLPTYLFDEVLASLRAKIASFLPANGP